MNRTRSILSALGAVAVLAVGGLVALRGPALADGGAAMPLSPESLYATVKAYVEAGPAAEGSPTKDRVRDLIVSRVKATGAKVQVLPLTAQTPAGEWHLENVVVSFRPEAKDRVLIGAHWDTRLWAEREKDPAKRNQPITGANDGGSGVAVLIGLAEVLAKDPPPEGLGVDLAFFEGEEGFHGDMEEWFYGSRDLAERWFRTGVAVPRAVVIVDMVAKKGLQIPRESISDSNPGGKQLLDQIFAIAKEKGYRSFVNRPGPHVMDDHLPFINRGITAVDLIDLDYEHWHTQQDTLDKIDPKSMAEVADVVLTWIRRGAPSK